MELWFLCPLPLIKLLTMTLVPFPIDQQGLKTPFF